MSGVLVMTCTCQHGFQDRQYGIGKRVHNYGAKNKIWRCTVCRKEKSKDTPTPKSEAKQ